MKGIRLAMGAIGALAVLTACGGGDSDFADGSAADINKAFETDMAKLESVHIAGSVTSDGSDVDLDLTLDRAGDCTGSIGVDGGSAEIIRLDDATWFRPDEAFWEASTGSAEQAQLILDAVGDKWVEVPPEGDSLGDVCDLDQILDQILTSSSNDPKKDGTDEVDGVEAVKLSREDDEDPDSTVTAWIAVEGKHYLLKYEKSGGQEPGSIVLTDFDEDIDVQAPPDDEIVDPAVLENLG